MNGPAVRIPEHPKSPSSPDDHRGRGLFLQWVTIAWNAAEVAVTVGLGLAAHSLALVAFGMDSLVEIFASLVVVWHMAEPDDAIGRRHAPALRLVALAFVLLAAYLIAGASHALLTGRRPDTSPWGMAYLAVTAVVMFTLARLKRAAGRRTGDGPFLAEASMTALDGFLALGILAALAVNAGFGWWWADPAAAAIIAVAALHEAWGNWRTAAAAVP